MCIWKVDGKDRLCDYCSFQGPCEERDCDGILEWDGRARRYVMEMSRICGCDILARARESQRVWARNIIAYQMRRDGYTLRHIASAINRDHATVLHAEKQVQKMLELPRMYREEYGMWQKFQQSISSFKDKDYVEENSEMVVLQDTESCGTEG